MLITLNMTKSPLSSALPTLPPKEEAGFVFAREAKRRSKLPGGWFFVKYVLFAHSVGFFTIVQNDV